MLRSRQLFCPVESWIPMREKSFLLLLSREWLHWVRLEGALDGGHDLETQLLPGTKDQRQNGRGVRNACILWRRTRALCELSKTIQEAHGPEGRIRKGEVPEIFVIWDQVRNYCLSNVTLWYFQLRCHKKQGIHKLLILALTGNKQY